MLWVDPLADDERNTMPHPALETRDPDHRYRIALTVLLVAIAAWGIVDLILDAPTTLFSVHVVVEVTFVLLTLAALATLWLGWMRTRVDLRDALARAEAGEGERDEWRARAQQLLRGLGVEIDGQFERWGLTPAEREIGLLLLKGMGHKEIAAVLERSERTIRQHAVAVYRKSGLAGRAALSAFFLEDLLLPATGLEVPGERPRASARA